MQKVKDRPPERATRAFFSTTNCISSAGRTWKATPTTSLPTKFSGMYSERLSRGETFLVRGRSTRAASSPKTLKMGSTRWCWSSEATPTKGFQTSSISLTSWTWSGISQYQYLVSSIRLRKGKEHRWSTGWEKCGSLEDIRMASSTMTFTRLMCTTSLSRTSLTTLQATSP